VCTDEKLGKSLVLYQTGMMSAAETHEFEAHLLECDTCYDALRRLDADMCRTLHALVAKRERDATDGDRRPPRDSKN